MWVRGLKQSRIFHRLAQYHVAPRVGAWIETRILLCLNTINSVAPRVGAWIETWAGDNFVTKIVGSHPVWVRGLKPLLLLSDIIVPLSHPVWVRGLKHAFRCGIVQRYTSHPVWVRGLKL